MVGRDVRPTHAGSIDPIIQILMNAENYIKNRAAPIDPTIRADRHSPDDPHLGNVSDPSWGSAIMTRHRSCCPAVWISSRLLLAKASLCTTSKSVSTNDRGTGCAAFAAATEAGNLGVSRLTDCLRINVRGDRSTLT